MESYVFKYFMYCKRMRFVLYCIQHPSVFASVVLCSILGSNRFTKLVCGKQKKFGNMVSTHTRLSWLFCHASSKTWQKVTQNMEL